MSPGRVAALATSSRGHRQAAPVDLLTALAAVAGLAATYYVAVQTRTGQVVDTRVMDLTTRALLGVHWPGAVLAFISPVTELLAITTLGVLVWVSKGMAAALEASCTVVGTSLAAVALKVVLGRPKLLDDAGNSLPSGHVAAVAGVAAAIALVTGRANRLLVVVAGGGAVAMTGVATLALGWHRPSDVLASALVAIAVAATTRCSVAAVGARPAEADKPSRPGPGVEVHRQGATGAHRRR